MKRTRSATLPPNPLTEVLNLVEQRPRKKDFREKIVEASLACQDTEVGRAACAFALQAWESESAKMLDRVELLSQLYDRVGRAKPSPGIASIHYNFIAELSERWRAEDEQSAAGKPGPDAELVVM